MYCDIKYILENYSKIHDMVFDIDLLKYLLSLNHSTLKLLIKIIPDIVSYLHYHIHNDKLFRWSGDTYEIYNPIQKGFNLIAIKNINLLPYNYNIFFKKIYETRMNIYISLIPYLNNDIRITKIYDIDFLLELLHKNPIYKLPINLMEYFIVKDITKLKYINCDYEKSPLNKIALTALKVNINAICYIDPKYMSKEICDYVSSLDTPFISRLPQKYLTENKCIEILSRYPHLIKYLDKTLITPKICNVIIDKHIPELLQYCKVSL